ncbi:MAG: hypothetical protein D6B25_03940 [Desulfobulbaceae bacterium]|nr:MAG: hypothetical protein D6B25_03940 [Desulfobulbaceae bacterium]
MKKSQHKELRADPATINEFVNALQRLFKIGIYYPSGHAILDKATERFMAVLKRLAGDNPSVSIQEYGNTLMIEGVEMEEDFPYVQEFRQMLTDVGIAELEVSREIRLNELHDFVRKMLAAKAKVQRTKSFIQISVADIPHSITVKLKEYLARTDKSISEERSGEAAENLESFIESLQNFGLKPQEIEQCKVLLESLPDKLTESSVDMSDLPSASWDDVARLLASSVRAGKGDSSDLRNKVITHSNISALSAILKKLELETTDKTSRESINLLISIIRKPFADSENELLEEEQSERYFPDKPEFSIPQIEKWALKNKLHPKVLKNIPEATPQNEILSILMQLALHDQELQTQIRMQQLFRENLSSTLSDAAWNILSSGLQAVIHDGNTNRVSAILRHLIDPLRRSRKKNGGTLRLLLMTARLCNPQDRMQLWPYIVNEILVLGPSSDAESYQNLCKYAASLSNEEMTDSLSKLMSMEAFEDKTVAPDIFHGITTASYPLFAFLYKTELETYIGERIVGGLKRNPPDWLGKAVVPLLDLSVQEHKLFLYSYLRQAGQKVLPASLKAVAARIIFEQLPKLSEEKRAETWVQKTISAMANLHTAETRELLEQIASTKKLLFIHQWPTECRTAATAALAAIKKKR